MNVMKSKRLAQDRPRLAQLVVSLFNIAMKGARSVHRVSDNTSNK